MKKILKYPKARAMLSDVLPFEVPIFFSNRGFYLYFLGLHAGGGVSAVGNFLIAEEKKQKGMWTLPFAYKVRVNDEKDRVLHLIHPIAQLQISKFYDRCSDLMISLCSRSTGSLRYPSYVPNSFVEVGALSKSFIREEGVLAEAMAGDISSASSYFAYKKYAFLHQYYDSFELINAEKKFRLQMSFDISKCFYNIYTHTIDWSIKGKDFSKSNIGRASFGSEFDKLMQNANHGETNGIVVGPEFSRIFAEIILQGCDAEAVGILEQEGIRQGIDFDFRRYVDDYFIFSNSDASLEEIFKVFKQCLEKIKLYINESKVTSAVRAPFVTDISIVKSDLGRALSGLPRDLGLNISGSGAIISVLGQEQGKAYDPVGFEASRKQFLHVDRVIKKYVGDIRDIVSRREVDYASCSRYVLGHLQKIAIGLKDITFDSTWTLSPGFTGQMHKLITALLEISAYAYSMNPVVSTTYKFAAVISSLREVSERCGVVVNEAIDKLISDEIGRVFDFIKSYKGCIEVELCNLLVVHRSLPAKYMLNEGQLVGLVMGADKAGDVNWGSISYFKVLSLLYYIQDSPGYSSLVDRLKVEIRKRYFSGAKLLEGAESVMLLMDLCSCPYLDAAFRQEVASELLGAVHKQLSRAVPSPAEVAVELGVLSANTWFADWEKRPLALSVAARELRTPY